MKHPPDYLSNLGFAEGFHAGLEKLAKEGWWSRNVTSPLANLAYKPIGAYQGIRDKVTNKWQNLQQDPVVSAVKGAVTSGDVGGSVRKVIDAETARAGSGAAAQAEKDMLEKYPLLKNFQGAENIGDAFRGMLPEGAQKGLDTAWNGLAQLPALAGLAGAGFGDLAGKHPWLTGAGLLGAGGLGIWGLSKMFGGGGQPGQYQYGYPPPQQQYQPQYNPYSYTGGPQQYYGQ